MRSPFTLPIIGLIRLYRATLGRIVGGNCRFHPSCSEYALDAVRLNGALRGSGQALWRIVRCGPWSKGGVDYPRPRRSSDSGTLREGGREAGAGAGAGDVTEASRV